MVDNKLKFALINNIQEEIIEYNRVADTLEYRFSNRYCRKRRKVIDRAIKTYWENGKSEHTSRPRNIRRRTVLIAALVTFLIATSAVVAIVKPEIALFIKERVTNWHIVFEQSSQENQMAFKYIDPPVPKNYRVIDELKGENCYYVTYRDESGREIGYAQLLPDDATISIDSEQVTPRRTKIKGMDLIIYSREDATIIVFENGDYVFMIDGTCDEELLLDITEKMILN